MLKKLLENKLRILLILMLVLALAAIRAFENQLFYDPFLEYFKSNYQAKRLPEIDYFNLFLSYFFRYFLNSIVSSAIIYLAFKDLEIVKFSSLLYIFLFVILIISFYVCLNVFENNKMTLFYIRRFLIQPLFLLLFLPGFYLQRKS